MCLRKRPRTISSLFRLRRPQRRANDARLVEKFRRHEPRARFQTREKFIMLRADPATDDDQLRPNAPLEHAKISVEPPAPLFPGQLLALAHRGRDEFFIRFAFVWQVAEFA